MTTLSDYVAKLPPDVRGAVDRIYARARKLFPEAIDGVSYGMPALLYRGKALVSVMSARAHLGLYPFSPAALDTVRADLEGFSLSKGTIRFTVATPLPAQVVDRLIRARAREIDQAK